MLIIIGLCIIELIQVSIAQWSCDIACSGNITEPVFILNPSMVISIE